MEQLDKKILDEKYLNPPLKRVVCEIRFPTLLKIADSIEEFQSKIRDKLPEYLSRTEPRLIKDGTLLEETWWNFTSSDGKTAFKVKNNLALLTSQEYKTFDIFIKEIEEFFNLFFDTTPTLNKYTRIGLRYTNTHIIMSKTPFKELQKYFTFPEIKINEGMEYLAFNSKFSRKIDDNNLHVGYSYDKNQEDNYVFLFDYDSYHLGEIERVNYIDMIKALHLNIKKSFHSNITDKYKEEILMKGEEN